MDIFCGIRNKLVINDRILKITILCVWVFCSHVCVCAMCAWCLQRLEEGVIDALELEL